MRTYYCTECGDDISEDEELCTTCADWLEKARNKMARDIIDKILAERTNKQETKP